MSNWRLWLFRITAITVIPALFLVSLEGGLRILDFGYPARFAVKCEVNGRLSYCNNDKFSWLFFPRRLARPIIPFVIPEDKPAKTYRIFVLGGSAAQGDPEHTFGVARILKVMLQNQYPQISFEVVNAAVTAINSHVVLKIATDLARHQTDLFILYLGNNEVVGPFGAGTVFSPLTTSLTLIRTSIFLKSTRVGQILERLLKLATKEKPFPMQWGGMEMFLEKQVRGDDPGMENVYNHFQKNLEDVLRVAGKTGIKTILSTVVSNLKDSAPFASLHRRDISDDEKKAWNTIYQSGIKLELAGKYAKAIRRYLEAAHIDNGFADLHYRLGRCYWALGNYGAARERYIQARHLDTLRFRADTRINNIIRKTAGSKSSEGIYLVDTVQLFEDRSPHQTPGKEQFHDHVHLNFRGNYILAEGLFRQIARILPAWVNHAKNEGEPLTEDECTQLLAFTGYDRHRVSVKVFESLRKPPFSNQLYHQEQIRQMKRNQDDLQIYAHPNGLKEAALQYRSALQNPSSDAWLHYNYAELLHASERFREGSEQLRLFLQYLPQYASAHEKLAEILILQGKFEEAITQCKKALRINPQFTSVLYHMAFALAEQGKFDQSIEQYKKLIKLDPEKSIDLYNQIGKIQVHLGELAKAEKTFRNAIELNGEFQFRRNIPDLHFNLAFVLKRMNKPEEATRELQKAIQGYRKKLGENPESSETHTVLGKALAESGDYQEATRNFQQAIDLDPTNLTKYMNLIRVLEIQGRFDEAIEVSQKAIRFMLKDSQKEAATMLERHLENLQSKAIRGNHSERQE